MIFEKHQVILHFMHYNINGVYHFFCITDENKKWFLDMKVLVESVYIQNGNTPITIIVHSMGGPMTLVFLQQQSDAWKNKYISRIISLAGAWGGSVKAIKVFAIGDDLGSFALSGKILRAEQITSPSLAWLLPSPLFWKPDEVMVRTQSREYTLSQLEDFFNDLRYPNGWEMRKDTIKYTDFTAPGVEVHCLYGSNVSTVELLDYKKTAGLDGTPTLLNGDGDGTVNARSLQGCRHWINMKQQNKKNVTCIDLPGVDHMSILSSTKVIKYILDILSG